MAASAIQYMRGTITTENLVDAGTSTVGGSVEVDVKTSGALMVQVTGTYTATGGLSAQITINGTTWITLGASSTFTRQSTGVATAAITSAEQDIYQVAVTGARRFRVTALGAVTGTATITIQPVELSLGGGGSAAGGGGATTIADGADIALGATDDPAETNPANDAGLVALFKGFLQLVAAADNQLPATIGKKSTALSLAISGKSGGDEYEVVAASQTNVTLGTTGAAGDYIEGLLCVVSTAATSQVQLKDGSDTAFTVLPNNVGGGVGVYPVPLGMTSRAGAWQLTTGAGVAVIACGDFAT